MFYFLNQILKKKILTFFFAKRKRTKKSKKYKLKIFIKRKLIIKKIKKI